MKLFYTVIFFSLLTSAAFARGESILARVTSYWAAEGPKFASTGSTTACWTLRRRSQTNSVRQ
jgi:hypothetical protein